jgi:hypothetical protein
MRVQGCCSRTADPSPALVQDPSLRQAALVDLCLLAESKGQDAPRRARIFADEDGAAWGAAARVCLGEV